MAKLAMTVRQRLQSERGIAIPTALMLIVIGLGLAAAAIASTISAQRGSLRDQDRKEAIAAADAGISQALFRENKVPTTIEQRCVTLDGGGALVAQPELSDGWCAEHTGTVGTSTYAYRVKPWTEVFASGQWRRQMEIASVGTSDGVSRRVAVIAESPTGKSIFGPNRAIGVDGVTIGGESTVNVSTGSNQSVTLENNGVLCGDATHGPGGGLIINNNGGQCPGFSTNEAVTNLPRPDISSVTEDSTWKFFSVNTKTGNATWSPSTRTLSLDSAIVNLTEGDYILCRLDMQGSSSLIVPNGNRVRIFFDKPENCGMSDGDRQIEVMGDADIRATGYNPADPTTLPHFYMVGSDMGIRTEAYFSGNSGTYEFVLYAPLSDVTILGNGTYRGAVAGNTLSTGGSAILSADQDLPSPDVQTVLIYRPGRYLECTGATGSPPDANC